MRATFLVVVGLLACGAWAASARAQESDLPIPVEFKRLETQSGRVGAIARGEEKAYKGTLSGTLLRRTQTTTLWYLYPGACNQRRAGTWTPATADTIADSLNTYDPLLQNHGYDIVDLSLKERLWHIDDGSTKLGSFPLPIDGARSLWCGKTDANWIVKSGYPNLTFQILYFDTDPSAAGGGPARTSPYTLSWSQYLSTEYLYDFMYVIGGAPGAKDPIGNSRTMIDQVISAGSEGGNELLVSFTGSQVANQSLAYMRGGIVVRGAGAGPPTTVTVSLSNIPASMRAIYMVFYSDCLFSSEDGLWPEGNGAVLDLVGTSDRGLLYDDQLAAGGTDSYGGDVLVGTPANPLISARVAPGVGGMWQLESGATLPTADFCSPQKSLPSDIMFLGADATTKLTVPNTFASIRSCTFPIPAGTATVLAYWGEYVDLPWGSGMVQFAEYRFHKGGTWSNWQNCYGGSVVTVGGFQAWGRGGAELAAAVQADSVQLRYNMQCIPAFAIDGVNCQPVTYGILYDDLRLDVITGVPAPVFGTYLGPVTHFIDGSDVTSVNCTPAQIAASQCWPGIRGSGIAGGGAIHDNVNTTRGDSIGVNLLTGLRKNDMGINWRLGFDKAVNGGLTIAHTNGAWNPAHDVPRIIYRLYDPATFAWSPWDSSELDADAVSISGVDTVIINGAFRYNWPPRDKLGAAASLPVPAGQGSPFTINGKALYSQLAFLPRGCRLQYYFKAVDINGGIAYDFGWDAPPLFDLPKTPGSPPTDPPNGPVAPCIREMSVLPGVYPPGAPGTLLAGRTDTPVLDLDAAAGWWWPFNPVREALRGLGVRADRFRGANIGGHRLPGQRADVALDTTVPNLTEYGILTKLVNQYRIVIASYSDRPDGGFDEQDAILLRNWWNMDTGTDGGDRCFFLSGDNAFDLLLNASLSYPQHTQRVSLAQDVFGVASVIGAWTGANTNMYPTVTDNFAGISYPLDGGCPWPNRADGLVKGGAADITIAAAYPGGVTELAGVARSSENDVPGSTDNDRSKALAYSTSIEYLRTAGIPTSAANYVRSGIENRMRVLFKFLTSCRGMRTPSQTTVCWPCPSNYSDLTGNWSAASANFAVPTAGPLYPIQDNTFATGVVLPEVPAVNHLEGNFPNPFNPETEIRFTAAGAGKVTIRIFDVAGRVVTTLSKTVTAPGADLVRWNGKAQDGRQLASGVYFYRIRFANGQESDAKMTMLK